uniref:Uncharacterized protein n=1 Tax=Eutreptiella gymnastica TaxID=73025 RepID=A0A7S1NC15_9EUGL
MQSRKHCSISDHVLTYADVFLKTESKKPSNIGSDKETTIALHTPQTAANQIATNQLATNGFNTLGLHIWIPSISLLLDSLRLVGGQLEADTHQLNSVTLNSVTLTGHKRVSGPSNSNTHMLLPYFS